MSESDEDDDVVVLCVFEVNCNCFSSFGREINGLRVSTLFGRGYFSFSFKKYTDFDQ